MTVALAQTTPERVAHAERSELGMLLAHNRSLYNEHVRRLVLDHRRIDVLATEVLGYEVQPFHLSMLLYQFRHPRNLQLVFRGAGKSTLCTVTKCIHLLLLNPELRILISSKTITNAEGFLKEIKGHLESNAKLAEIFGQYFDARRTTKWDSREIEVLQKKKVTKEASITCAGVDGTIVSKHYDVMISDDLVDEDNSRTTHMRDKTRTWYYKTLDPCLEPPSDSVPFRGEHHMQGTRYHYDDLYGKLIDGELREHHNIIKPYDTMGRTVWPAKYSREYFREKEERAGVIIFAGQYLNDVEMMKGEVFDYDDCVFVPSKDVPSGLSYFIGVDLAVSLKKKNDRFALVVLGTDGKQYWCVDHFADRIRVAEQTKVIRKFWRRWKGVVGIEVNAYQEAQKQLLEDADKNDEMVIVPIHTVLDKLTKAWKLAPQFEAKKMLFVEDQGPVISEIVGVPNGERDDLFDAYDNAFRASKMGRRRKRDRKTFGVL